MCVLIFCFLHYKYRHRHIYAHIYTNNSLFNCNNTHMMKKEEEPSYSYFIQDFVSIIYTIHMLCVWRRNTKPKKIKKKTNLRVRYDETKSHACIYTFIRYLFLYGKIHFSIKNKPSTLCNNIAKKGNSYGTVVKISSN